MNKLNVIGVDLAKNVIQISILSPANRALSNRSLSRRKFAEFLAKQRPGLVAFEACATAHYWARTAQRHGHDVKIIPAKVVAPFRLGHVDPEHRIPTLSDNCLNGSYGRSSARDQDQIEDIRSGKTCSAVRPWSPSTH